MASYVMRKPKTMAVSRKTGLKRMKAREKSKIKKKNFKIHIIHYAPDTNLSCHGINNIITTELRGTLLVVK